MNSRQIIFITGGIRSGKSSWALYLGEALEGRRAFIAPALPLDDETQQRIKRHQIERGERWVTFEEPCDLIATVNQKIGDRFDIVLIDCLTMWLSNLLTVYTLSKEEILQKIMEFKSCLPGLEATIILVSNEVGMGIIPADSLSRSFQDLLGSLNKEIADLADAVYFMVSGTPLKIKPYS